MDNKNLKLTNKNATGKVSVIVPVYNCEQYLHRCLKSITEQTYKELEIICIDDGSTDRSVEMLNYFAKKDDRIKLILQENKGVSAARNAGLDAATGEYISFVDADDYLQLNAYEILTETALNNHLDMIIFGGNVISYRQEMDWVQDILNTRYKYYKDFDGCRLIFEEKAARPFLWLHFIKRSILESPSKLRFNENMNLGEDQLMQFNYIPRTKNVMVIEDKLYNYRINHNTSLMSIYGARRVKKVECHFELVENIIKDWKKQGYYETSKDDIASWLVNFMYFTIADFPNSFKSVYAKRLLDIMEKNEFFDIYINEDERWCYEQLKMFALNDRDEMADIEKLTKKIENEKFQISETLKSRAFRLGRKLVRKKDRLDLTKYELK